MINDRIIEQVRDRLDPPITWGGANIGGTSLRGYFESDYSFEETVARLITLSRQNAAEAGDGYKVSVAFSGTFDGWVFTLYDWKGGRQLHIGGTARLDVDRLSAELRRLLRTVQPTDYEATSNYDDVPTTHGWRRP